jgi:hypothetical protein
MRYFLILVLSTALAGCSVAGIVESLSRDDASACLSISTVWGSGKLYRTKLPAGTVKCSDDGMSVTSRTP